MNLFSKNESKVILFLGYGFNEFELIRYFVQKQNPNAEKMYILKEYYSNETTKYQLEKTYYADFGMDVLCYLMDTKGYDCLMDVLEKWEEDIKNRTFAHLAPNKALSSLFSKSPNESDLDLGGCIKNIKIILNGEDGNRKLVNALSGSEHLSEWLPVLYEHTDMFFAKKRFKPMEKREDGKRVFPNWPELQLLKEASTISDSNDELIIHILKTVCELVKEDSGKAADEHLAGNHYVLFQILKLVLQKEDYVKGIDFVSLAKEYIFNNNDELSSLQDLLDKKRELLFKLSGDDLFDIFSSLLKKKDEAYINKELLSSEQMKSIISKSPEKFYCFAEECLKHVDIVSFYNVGALAEYQARISDDIIGVYLQWIKYACSYLNDAFLIKETKKLIDENSRTANKIALLIISERYEACKKNFLEQSVFNKKCIYLDIAYILDHCEIEHDVDEIETMILNSTFENEKNEKIKILQLNLLLKLPKYLDQKYKPITDKKDLDYVANYGKVYYEIANDPIDTDYIFNMIKDADYSELEVRREELEHMRIPFFEDEWNKTYVKFLLNNDGRVLHDHLDEICRSTSDSEIIAEINYALREEKGISDEIKCGFLSGTINKIDYKDENNIKSYLFLMKYLLIGNGELADFIYDVFLRIDERSIEKNLYEESVFYLINSAFYNYYDLFIELLLKTGKDYNYIFSEINRDKNNKYIKAVLALLYLKISELKNFNESDLINIILPAENDNYQLILDSLSFYGWIREKALDRLIELDLYKRYLLSEEDKDSKKHILILIDHYLKEEKYSHIIWMIIEQSSFGRLTNIIADLSQYSDELISSEAKPKRANLLLKKISERIKAYPSNDEIEYHFFSLTAICIDHFHGKLDELWNVAIELSKKTNVYVFKDSIYKILENKEGHEDVVFEIAKNLSRYSYYGYEFTDCGILAFFQHYCNTKEYEKAKQLLINMTKKDDRYAELKEHLH